MSINSKSNGSEEITSFWPASLSGKTPGAMCWQVTKNPPTPLFGLPAGGGPSFGCPPATGGFSRWGKNPDNTTTNTSSGPRGAGELTLFGRNNRGELSVNEGNGAREVTVKVRATDGDEALQVDVSVTLPHANRPRIEEHTSSKSSKWLDKLSENSLQCTTRDSPGFGTSSAVGTSIMVLPKIESKFQPRFRNIRVGMPAHLEERFVGWYRSYYNSEILMQYGHKENPLCEIIPRSAIGDLAFDGLRMGPTLTEKQNALESRVWNEDVEVTNVARAASSSYWKRPTIWIELNHEVWICRTQFEGLRIRDTETPLGYASAVRLIMKCVRAKREWYYHAGQANEADYYLSQFVEVFLRRRD